MSEACALPPGKWGPLGHQNLGQFSSDIFYDTTGVITTLTTDIVLTTWSRYGRLRNYVKSGGILEAELRLSQR